MLSDVADDPSEEVVLVRGRRRGCHGDGPKLFFFFF